MSEKTLFYSDLTESQQAAYRELELDFVKAENEVYLADSSYRKAKETLEATCQARNVLYRKLMDFKSEVVK